MILIADIVVNHRSDYAMNQRDSIRKLRETQTFLSQASLTVTQK